METVKFHKSECGVEFLLNVLYSSYNKDQYVERGIFNTDFFEIIFVRSGKAVISLDHTKIDIKKDSVLFISTFQQREWLSVSEDFVCTSLVFQEEFLNEFFADKLFTFRLLYFYQLHYPLVLDISEILMEKYCNLLKEVKSELLTTRNDSAHIIRSLIYYLLQFLNREYADLFNLSIERNENNYAIQYRKLLEQHIKEKQRVNDYVDILGISRITLNKLVKKQFKMTANDLLKQRLLIEIKNEIIHASRSIVDISYRFGFSEPNHLMRFFKSQSGETIGQFLSSYKSM
ncbi:AraC family transcriptional regulator [Sphingobacterium sp.]|uniref:helix-turn-helix domain-containing protein n=1 Tax=Sphingobacterium sp. TaxID=341027 RepID=UPI00289B638A|nr:AraC family transcriptional regulator [Sphingobacterium sp.]